MKFISLFSGVGGFDLGLERAGMECVAQVEINKAARGVLATHYPHVERLEDVTKVGKHNLPSVDLICGGSPCQDVSVAGHRKGLAGERSGLFFEFIRILNELAPAWFVFENVPGLLSSNGGRDFGVILSSLVNIGYRCTWRVLDAQHFGVPQRRRRVFIVGHLRDGRSAEILFEREGSTRGIETGETTGQATADETGRGVAKTLTTRSGMRQNPYEEDMIVGTLAASGAGSARPAGQANELDFLIANTVLAQYGQGSPRGDGNDKIVATAFTWHVGGSRPMTIGEGTSPTLTVSDATPMGVHCAQGVRRLTPTECERLQGFPDHWTAYSDGKTQADSARYRQLGNAVAVPVAEWIGKRIMANTD